MAGRIQTWVNLVSFLLQAFVVSRIFKYIGVRGALFILPVIALGGYTMIALMPVFAVVQWAKILENSTDYSIQNTTRHALFLPTSREAKYKAKQAIDSFFVRAGDMLQAAVVFIGTMLAFSVRGYALVNVALVARLDRARRRDRARTSCPGAGRRARRPREAASRSRRGLRADGRCGGVRAGACHARRSAGARSARRSRSS